MKDPTSCDARTVPSYADGETHCQSIPCKFKLPRTTHRLGVVWRAFSSATILRSCNLLNLTVMVSNFPILLVIAFQ